MEVDDPVRCTLNQSTDQAVWLQPELKPFHIVKFKTVRLYV